MRDQLSLNFCHNLFFGLTYLQLSDHISILLQLRHEHIMWHTERYLAYPLKLRVHPDPLVRLLTHPIFVFLRPVGHAAIRETKVGDTRSEDTDGANHTEGR